MLLAVYLSLRRPMFVAPWLSKLGNIWPRSFPVDAFASWNRDAGSSQELLGRYRARISFIFRRLAIALAVYDDTSELYNNRLGKITNAGMASAKIANLEDTKSPLDSPWSLLQWSFINLCPDKPLYIEIREVANPPFLAYDNTFAIYNRHKCIWDRKCM